MLSSYSIPSAAFQSTPSRPSQSTRLRTRFNPRPRARANPGCGEKESNSFRVSIHALARGRTRAILATMSHTTFQSTPSREGEPSWYSFFLPCQEFQSTPSREGELVIQG